MIKYYFVNMITPEFRETTEFRCLSRQVALTYAGQRARHTINKKNRWAVYEGWIDIDCEHSPKCIWIFN